MSSLGELSISGHVAQAGDADWDDARAAWNLAADRRPAAVAFVQSAEDVAKVIGFAARHGLKVTGRGTGHGAAAGLRTRRGRDRLHARTRPELARAPLL